MNKKVIDVSLYRVSNEKFAFDFSEFDIVGFSISSSVTYPIIKKVRKCSRFKDDVLLIAGGIHATIFPDNVINELEIDIACVGKGEKKFLKLLIDFLLKILCKLMELFTNIKIK